MTMASLERSILAGAKKLLKNPKLKIGDILAWSTGPVEAQCDSEIVLHIPDPGVNICVAKCQDRRVE